MVRSPSGSDVRGPVRPRDTACPSMPFLFLRPPKSFPSTSPSCSWAEIPPQNGAVGASGPQGRVVSPSLLLNPASGSRSLPVGSGWHWDMGIVSSGQQCPKAECLPQCVVPSQQNLGNGNPSRLLGHLPPSSQTDDGGF